MVDYHWGISVKYNQEFHGPQLGVWTDFINFTANIYHCLECIIFLRKNNFCEMYSIEWKYEAIN